MASLQHRNGGCYGRTGAEKLSTVEEGKTMDKAAADNMDEIRERDGEPNFERETKLAKKAQDITTMNGSGES
ncbi:hypothetical protein IMSHALPRED_008289 [Imshaugia aleurites]|uniref:Uncharacterized protein n=1 Tax=Imshaugia aleurites TaxID=172621 RepID=A0A8H3G0D3_9LECA|nr:hypothetical protein IMSHALPRED_008289 [Imshaugia aleurites]